MKKSPLKILLSFLMILSIIFSLNCNAFALESDDIIGIAYGGNTSQFPENSFEAIASCKKIGLNGATVGVKKTRDNILIAFADDDLSRMCGVDGSVSEKTYDEISKLGLLNGSGGALQNKTEYYIPKLSDVLKLSEEMLLILDVDENIFDDVAGAVKDSKNVYIRCKEMKCTDLISKGENLKISVLPYYRGNVIFTAISDLNKTEKANLPVIQFATNNQYGVLFTNFFTSKFKNVKGMFSFAFFDSCGKRPDNNMSWENVIDAGYSVIETKDAAGLAEYIKSLKLEKDNLEKIIKNVKGADFSLYSESSVASVNSYVEEAEKILDGSETASLSTVKKLIADINTDLSSLSNQNDSKINKGEFKITLPRILWALFGVLLFVSAQLYIKKKTRKTEV